MCKCVHMCARLCLQETENERQIKADRAAEMRTQMSMDGILFKVCQTRKPTVYHCRLTLFYIKVTGSLRSDSSAASLCLNQYSLSDYLRERDWSAAGNSCWGDGGGGGAEEETQSIHRSECGSATLEENTEWRTAKLNLGRGGRKDDRGVQWVITARKCAHTQSVSIFFFFS